MTEKRFDIVVAAKDMASSIFQKVGQAYDSMRSKLNGGGGSGGGGGAGGGGGRWDFQKIREEAKAAQQRIVDGTDDKPKRGSVGNAVLGRLATVGGFEMVGRGVNTALDEIIRLQGEIASGAISIKEAWDQGARAIASSIPVVGQFFEAGQKIRSIFDGSAAELAAIQKQTAENEKQNELMKQRIALVAQVRTMMQGIADENRTLGKSGIGLETEQLKVDRDRKLREIAEKERRARNDLGGGSAFDGSAFDSARAAVRDQYEAKRSALFKSMDAEGARETAEMAKQEAERSQRAAKQIADNAKREQEARDKAAKEALKAQRERNADFLAADSELYEAQLKAIGQSVEAQQEAIRRSFDARLAGASSTEQRRLLEAQMNLQISQANGASANDIRNSLRGGVDLGGALGDRYTGLAQNHDPGLAAMLKVSENTKKLVEEITKLRLALMPGGAQTPVQDYVIQ